MKNKKNLIAVVKVTAELQNVNDSLSRWIISYFSVLGFCSSLSSIFALRLVCTHCLECHSILESKVFQLR